MAVNLGSTPTNVPITAPTSGVLTQQWFDYFNRLNAALLQVQTIANNSLGTNAFNLAAQPSLGTGDVGYVGVVLDFGHLVYWTGTAWIFMGDYSGYVAMQPAAPIAAGWQLCDGTTTTYLSVGATLTATSFTTPDMITNAVYLKTGALYTGSIVSAAAPGITGTTGTHFLGADYVVVSGPVGTVDVQSGSGTTVANSSHTHHTDDFTGHSHAAGTLAVDATGEPTHVIWLPYFRR